MFLKIRNIIKEYKELKYLAYHDALTGLLNRNWYYKNEKFLLDNYVYIYFIDIVDLHKVNKSKGHVFGDEYIKSIIKKIPIEKGDLLIRYAGDEFCLFSNRLKIILSNDLVSVGVSEIKDSLIDAVKKADFEMLKNKYSI